MTLLDVSIHAVHTCAPEHFPITIEAVAAHASMPAYYRIQLDGVRMVITDQHRRDILECLASAPPLPKSDAQIDMHLRRYMSECASGLWRVGGPDAEF